MLNPYSDPPVKCGLYQMRLIGTMNINVDYLINKWKLTGVVPSVKINHKQFQTLNNDNHSEYIQPINRHYDQWSTKMKYNNLGYRINRYKKSPSYKLVKNTDYMYTHPLIHSKMTKIFVSCHIELSDFNRTHGSTGEFGNKIWIHNDCLYQQIQSSFNTSELLCSYI
ncbi:hypothetical protein Smp_183610 [Schistosoma mansoni]|uniref:hypothetical protein n=1 Tax=Schistosoma mansoni TaxID=6183 RepID=UPI00022DC0F8|nr:hypothetical protein Smp_183610 [Schistosoma mansoni]|eukprot:XP_018652001.1 hypothetical protein Smp_183610 [Schistosoma mansoni]